MNLEKYKVLLFDLDDTLLDFAKAERKAFKKLLSFYNVDFSEEKFGSYKEINHKLWSSFERGEISNKEVIDTRFVKFFNTLGIEVDGLECDNRYRTYLTEGDQLYAGVRGLLEKLAESHTLCVASNGIAITQHKRLDNNEIRKYFEKIYISEEIGAKKPEQQFFNKIFEDFSGIAKEQFLIVGDNINADILGGFNAGIDTCWINAKNKVNTLEKEPTYIAKNVLELLN